MHGRLGAKHAAHPVEYLRDVVFMGCIQAVTMTIAISVIHRFPGCPSPYTHNDYDQHEQYRFSSIHLVLTDYFSYSAQEIMRGC